MNTRHPLSPSRPGPACAAFEPLLPLVAHDLLEPDEARRLQAHVATCAHCQARLAAYDRLDAALRRRSEQIAMPPLNMRDIMKRIEEQQETGAFESPEATPAYESSLETPAPPLRPRAAGVRPKPRRVVSWLSAVAAVLVIALGVAALVASHRSPSPGGIAAPASSPGVYFTADIAGSPPQTVVYALNPLNGTLRWQTKLPAGASFYLVRVDHGLLYLVAQQIQESNATKPVPTVQETVISVLRASDGKPLWHLSTRGATSAIVVADGVAYVGTDAGMLYALNTSDGAIRWQKPIGGSMVVKAVADGLVYFTAYHTLADKTISGKLFAFNASDGSGQWSLALQGDFATVQVFNGQVAVLDMQTVTASDGVDKTFNRLSVVNASDGSVKWRYQGDPSSVDNAIVAQDAVYVTLLSGSGKERPEVMLQALNLNDGSVRWEQSYASFSLIAFDQETTNGKVYVLVNRATLFALNGQNGAEVWHVRVGANANVPGLAEGMLFAQVQNELDAFNADDGSVVWRAQLDDGSQFLGVDHQVAYGVTKSVTPQEGYIRLFAIDALSGKYLWHYNVTVSFTGLTAG